mgnify:CR=1 FL=1
MRVTTYDIGGPMALCEACARLECCEPISLSLQATDLSDRTMEAEHDGVCQCICHPSLRPERYTA